MQLTSRFQLTSNLIRFPYVLMLLVSLVVADGIITEYLVNSGIGREGNPLLQNILAGGNLMPVKIAGVLLSVLLLGAANKRSPKWTAVVYWSFIAFYTLILYWNLAGIFLSGAWSRF
jgi:hypothetical protein